MCHHHFYHFYYIFCYEIQLTRDTATTKPVLYVSTAYAAPEPLCFCLACPVFCRSRAEYISSLHKNTERF